MTKQAAFTTEEWSLLRSLPSLLSAAVSMSDPSGILGSAQEAAAGVSQTIRSLHQGSGIELLNSMLSDTSVPALPDSKALLGEGSREQKMANLKSAILKRAEDTVDLLQRKATPDEVLAYKQMLMGVAEKVANASKEGGFLGFGGVRVSGAEQSFLNEVKGALKLT